MPPFKATRSLALPYYVYAVLSNSLFQRGVFVVYLMHQGFSAAEIALLQTLLYLVSALAEIPTGFLADRMGRRTSIVFGQSLIALCLVGEVTLSGYPWFVALFVLYGIGMAFVSGAETALLYDLLRRRGLEIHYVKVKSRYTTLGSLTMALAIAVGGSLQKISWELVYLGAAVALILSAAVMMAKVPELRGEDVADLDEPAGSGDGGEGDGDGDGPQLGKMAMLKSITPRLASLVLVSGLMHATMTPYFIFIQEALTHQGVATSLVSAVMSAAFLIGGFAPLLADRANQRLGVRTLVPLTLAVLVAALGFSGMEWAWLTIVVFLLAVGAPDITAVVVDDVFNQGVPSRYRSSLLSVITFVESLLIACGYFLLGWLIDAFGSGAGFAWYAVVPAVALVLSIPSVTKGRWVKAA
ncbi:MFS transporter [Streptomyces bambusae]|uniref:MFS transporter n=1 Tax=Streptomyces bambusae TaxID=1550616 RepID=UPI001CFFB04C|nr:MFS transporter [Streptomyces bambusae]MCB5169892.1 MFS transporter [Streptomyces bambusae]